MSLAKSSPAGKVKTFAELVKFEHTIFALPFAYLGAFAAARGWPALSDLFWITVAMIGARTGAMALNRLIDAETDAQNPRTASRHLPRGLLKRGEVLGLAVASLAVLLWAAYNLNPLCVRLFPLVILTLVAYSYTKRFTWLCHVVLGIADGWAPFGAWVAVTGTIDPLGLLLGAVVALWVGGFDLIYATQDQEFDRRYGLHSVPARFGIRTALVTARLTHLAVVALALGFGFWSGLLSLQPLAWGLSGWLYAVAWLFLAGLLHYEHAILSPTDLSRLNAAFFNINGYISVGYFVLTAAAFVTRVSA